MRASVLASLLLFMVSLGCEGGEVQTFSLASGEVLVHGFEGGIPLPAESRWSRCLGAGPAIVPEAGKFLLKWTVNLEAKDPPKYLARVTKVTLEEVSGKSVIPIFSGRPSSTADGILIVGDGREISRGTFPWLYTADPSVFVLRVKLEAPDEQPDVLLQPVLIGPEVKKNLKDRGYLP
ncbi:MAG: hypothetical protein U0X73_18190 [Thermoanaerobaculia bacterium]